MDWEQGEAPRRRGRWRKPATVAVCVLAVVALGVAARQATPPPDDFTVEEATEEPERPAPEPPPEPPPPVDEIEPAEGAALLEPQDVERRQLGPLMPVTTELTLSLVAADGTLTQVDLDTGDLVTSRLLEAGAQASPGLVRAGDGVVVFDQNFDGTGSAAAARYLTAPDQPGVDLGPAASGFPSVTPGRVWLSDRSPFYFGSSGGIVLREVALDSGQTTAEVTLPPGVSVHGAVTGGLVIDASNELIVYDPTTGSGRSLGGGRLVALDGDRLARWVCDPALRCGLEVGTVDQPDAVRLDQWQAEELGTLASLPFADAALSPDGRWLAFTAFDEEVSRYSVLDLDSGEVRLAPEGSASGASYFGPGAARFGWSGSWLFALTQQGVEAWDVETGLVVPIDLDLFQVAAFALR